MPCTVVAMAKTVGESEPRTTRPTARRASRRRSRSVRRSLVGRSVDSSARTWSVRCPAWARITAIETCRAAGARAAVFGVSDGLVSNVALILGMAGAHARRGAVRLAGIAGLIAGAFSMAAGEYISMRAQSELMQRELDVERQAIRHDPEDERRELAAIYESRGLDAALAEELSVKMMRDPDLALETHAREELGIHPGETGEPAPGGRLVVRDLRHRRLHPVAALADHLGAAATWWSVVLGAVGAFAVGAGLAHFTGRSWLWSACRQLLISGVAAAVTYSIGHLVGSRLTAPDPPVAAGPNVTEVGPVDVVFGEAHRAVQGHAPARCRRRRRACPR